MPLMMLWRRLNDAIWRNSSTAWFKTGGSCQTLKNLMLTESLSGCVCVGFLIVNQLLCLVSSHQHGLHLHPGWGVNVLQESWIFSTDGEAETCRHPPPPPPPPPSACSQLAQRLQLGSVFTGGTVGQLSSCSSNSNISTRGESSCQRGFSLCSFPLSRSLLDRLCDVVKRFAVQATIFKNTSGWRKTSPYLSHKSVPAEAALELKYSMAVCR